MMKLIVKLKLKAICAKHPRYNPERRGQSGIIGACHVCDQMYSLYMAKLSLEAAARAFEDKATCLSQEWQSKSTTAA